MDFQFTEEHEELRRTTHRFLESKSEEALVRRVMRTEEGYDPAVWKQMAEQLGLQGLIVPAEFGGAGLGFVEMAVVLEEMGRFLFCAPYLSSAVLAAAALIHAADDAARAEILPAIAGGEMIVSLAIAEEEGGWDPRTVQARASRSGAGWVVDGTKSYVLDGHGADVLLVAARTPDGVSLFRVAGESPGLARTLLPTLDLTRKLARIELSSTPALCIAPPDVAAALERVVLLGCVALAAEQAGGAQRCLEMSTEYAKTRLQFGRPIGSFQAIKHRCADLLVEVEFAKSAAYHAAFMAAEAGDDELAVAARMAKAYCSEAYFHAAAETIQIHGGMGFTWEHPAHLYFKRAKSSAMLFGEPLHHRERLAQQLGL
jgi:alkylation response protein AidB-like acyl-CoA dehydrogenase